MSNNTQQIFGRDYVKLKIKNVLKIFLAFSFTGKQVCSKNFKQF